MLGITDNQCERMDPNTKIDTEISLYLNVAPGSAAEGNSEPVQRPASGF